MSEPPFKRAKYEAKFKLKVVQLAKDTSAHNAAKVFQIDRKNVRNWLKNQTQLKEMPKNRCTIGTRKPKWPELEHAVFEFVQKMRESGFIVSRNMIRDESIKWAFENPALAKDFKATASWCDRFMKRRDLVLRQKTKIAQKLPADLEEKIRSFQRYIIKQRTYFNFPLSSIGNMDETPVQFDMLGSTTVDFKGAKTITVKSTGHEKSRFTVVLSCLANGVKLTPMVIFKRKTLPKLKFPPGILVHVQENGWIDEDGVRLWLNKIWDKRPGNFNNRSLLSWDMFRSHLTDKVKQNLKDLRTEQAVIPGGLTSVLQPLDVCLNRPFKQYLRELWNEWMVKGKKSYTNSGNMRAPELDVFCQFIIDAWAKVKTESVIKAFKKCCISNALDGSEDDILWDDQDDDDDDVQDDDDDDVQDDDQDDQDEWDPYYDTNVDHQYIEKYMQTVTKELFSE